MLQLLFSNRYAATCFFHAVTPRQTDNAIAGASFHPGALS
jgi:hypothetical protein